jgi:Double zinc ribbon
VDLRIHPFSLTRCPYCKQDNPADSRSCSACGGALHLPRHLAPCPRCGAVGPVKATVCYWCSGELPGRRALWAPQAIVGTAVLAAIAVLGYYIHRQLSAADAPQPPAASREASGRGVPAAGDTKSANPDSGAALTSPATSPSGTELATPARAVAILPRAGRQPIESPEAKAAATAVARPQAINAGKVGQQVPPSPEACTEAVAALGLCATKPVQKKEADKRPPTTVAGKAGGQEQPRPQTCTEAVTALGLCTPGSTQRRE